MKIINKLIIDCVLTENDYAYMSAVNSLKATNDAISAALADTWLFTIIAIVILGFFIRFVSGFKGKKSLIKGSPVTWGFVIILGVFTMAAMVSRDSHEGYKADAVTYKSILSEREKPSDEVLDKCTIKDDGSVDLTLREAKGSTESKVEPKVEITN